ncbi:TfoX/Sxy family DNA transformation protein [Methylocystis sp. FS]|uniref:TfoX/Sxy family DNA transformation protein n=1 Tax=Methylocystis silviterrae TaxID=2743612 RepID=UPI001AEDD7CF|nr:TfoX/Sxy family DNA transformation protein [Methylocystis silviterrae]NUJ79452.1 TfoX/Sxy family DNA transformation protein [Methylocystis silviterrae]
MNLRIEEMRNLGPATAKMLADVGVHREGDLRRIGAVDAYHRLKFRFGRQVTIIALYAMEAALRGCDWRSLDPETKEGLRRAAKY